MSDDQVLNDQTNVCPDDNCDCDMGDGVTNVEENIAAVTDDAPIAAPALTVAADSVTKFAPVMPPVKGKYNLYGLVIKWADNPGANVNSATNATRSAAKIYKELSDGLLDFTPIVKVVKVNLNHAAKNIPAAEKQAKATVPNPGNHVYVIYNNHAKNFSNGGGDTAHLLGTLTRDVLHEVGHCRPTDLGHSGAYKDGKLAPYDDGTSFMGRFASVKLTGAQLYLLGWLPENKVAQFDLTDPVTDFNVCNLYADNSASGVKVVLIPRGDQRPLYLSMPQVNGKPSLCLHLSTGRGTQRVTVFGNQASYEGVTFQKIADGAGFVTVRVTSTQN